MPIFLSAEAGAGLLAAKKTESFVSKKKLFSFKIYSIKSIIILVFVY